MKFIEKLQNKSRATRVLILWIASISLMAIIVIIWLFSFSKNIGYNAEKNTENTKLPSIFESLGKDFNIFKQGLEASLENIGSESSELEKQLEQYEGE